MAKKKVYKKSMRDRLNAGYEKMQAARKKERAGKCEQCGKGGCDCGR